MFYFHNTDYTIMGITPRNVLTNCNGMMVNYNFLSEIFQSGHGNLFSRKRFPSFHFFLKQRHDDDEHELRNSQYNTLKRNEEQTKLKVTNN